MKRSNVLKSSNGKNGSLRIYSRKKAGRRNDQGTEISLNPNKNRFSAYTQPSDLNMLLFMATAPVRHNSVSGEVVEIPQS